MIAMRNFVAACVVLAATLAHADSSVPEKGAVSPVLASLERTACYGRCPIYKVTVLRDGTVLWEGERFVKVTGKATAKVSAAAITDLAKAFARADFFALQDKYDSYDVTDHPSAITVFDDGKRKKTIHHYHGDHSAPKALVELEDRIDTLVGTSKWIGRER
ncbi:MAG: hypothetical protein JWM53_2204 [bacterium]|nr:hypothetical protein [bacterium]